MRQLAAAVALSLAAACGGDDGTVEPGAGGTTSAPSGSAPVALPGTVNDRGSKDLGASTDVAIVLSDFAFAPTYIKAAPGAAVKIMLKNDGSMAHTFTVDTPKVDVTVAAAGTGVAGFALPASGAVRFYCRFHAAQGMQGAFYVTAGATVTGSSGGDGGAYNQ